MNEEVKGWTSLLRQQEYPPEITKTKEEIRLEHINIKVKRAALEWDDFMLQEQLKSLFYIDCSWRGDPIKVKLIDELNFKNFACLSRKKTSKFFVGIISQKRRFIIHSEFYNIISDPLIQNLKRKPNMFHDLSRQTRYHF